MRKPVFIDTGYILALVNTDDAFYQQALDALAKVFPPFLTTEAVLTEIGNSLSRKRWRSLGVQTIQNLRSSADIEIVPVDTNLFDRAVTFYSSRLDKEWGLTDCISFVVMQEHNITHVLTTDKHFEQAGYQNILMKQ